MIIVTLVKATCQCKKVYMESMVVPVETLMAIMKIAGIGITKETMCSCLPHPKQSWLILLLMMVNGVSTMDRSKHMKMTRGVKLIPEKSLKEP